MKDYGFGIPLLAGRVLELEYRLGFPREWAITQVAADCELRSEAIDKLRECLADDKAGSNPASVLTEQRDAAGSGTGVLTVPHRLSADTEVKP